MKAGLHWLSVFLITTVCAVFVLGGNDDERFSKSSSNFTLKILKHMAAKNTSSNIVFSPVSISTLLSVLQQGARGNTLIQLDDLLQLSAEESSRGFSQLAALKGEKNVQLEWGNRCYVKQGVPLLAPFQERVKNFGVRVKEINFYNSPTITANEINDWVGRVTHGKINDMVEPSMVSSNTAMLLINAIFFKGKWLRPFKQSKSSDGIYETAPGKFFNLKYMTQREKFYSEKDIQMGAKWIFLPFENDRFAMVFILPIWRHKLSQLIEKLSAEDLYTIFSSRGVNNVRIRLPKFKLSDKLSLVDTLKQIGLTDLFSDESDLSGMTSEELHVSYMVHEANVEIDEKGSTSSAATVVELLRMRTPNLAFYADQPFLFFLIDTRTNVPLFAGRVVNPSV